MLMKDVLHYVNLGDIFFTIRLINSILWPVMLTNFTQNWMEHCMSIPNINCIHSIHSLTLHLYREWDNLPQPPGRRELQTANA